MKRQLKLIVLLFGVSFIFFMGCKKHDGLPITNIGTYTSQEEDGTLVGTFVATGGLTASGTAFMDVTPVGVDSIFCINKHIASGGTFTVRMKCSLTTMTGGWRVIEGIGVYSLLRGNGTLVMTFPPGLLGIETMTGTVWLHP